VSPDTGRRVNVTYWVNDKTEVLRDGKATTLVQLKLGEKVQMTTDNKFNVTKIVFTGEIDEAWLAKLEADREIAERNAAAITLAVAAAAAAESPPRGVSTDGRVLPPPSTAAYPSKISPEMMRKMLNPSKSEILQMMRMFPNLDYRNGVWVPRHPSLGAGQPQGRSSIYAP
jgi:hypothetical protein